MNRLEKLVFFTVLISLGGGLSHAKVPTCHPPVNDNPQYNDFLNRCSGESVLQCFSFDCNAEITPHVYPDYYDNEIRGTLDESEKASGNGSLRFEIPSGSRQDTSGGFSLSFGQEFGENSTFYVQFRQRFSPEMLDGSMRGNGWKQVLFINDGGPSCGNVEVTTHNRANRNKPEMYDRCGYDFTGNPQYEYVENNWMTFYYEVHIGNWTEPNSYVKAWMSADGDPLVQFVDHQNWRAYQNDGDPNSKYGQILLTPYHTDKERNAHPTAYTWYDELIISAAPIPAPGSGSPPLDPPVEPDPPPVDPPPTNLAPVVQTSSDTIVQLPNSLNISATVSDDGQPNPPNTTTTTWTKYSGPGIVQFENIHALNTTVTFSQEGLYVLRITANDGALKGFDDMTIDVLESPAGSAPPVEPEPSREKKNVVRNGNPAQISCNGFLSIEILDRQGRFIKELPCGNNQATITSNDLSSGIYFARSGKGETVKIQKIVVLK